MSPSNDGETLLAWRREAEQAIREAIEGVVKQYPDRRVNPTAYFEERDEIDSFNDGVQAVLEALGIVNTTSKANDK